MLRQTCASQGLALSAVTGEDTGSHSGTPRKVGGITGWFYRDID